VTSEEQAVALLAAANPIPDEESLELGSDTAQLKAATQRSGEVTDLNTQPKEVEQGTISGRVSAVGRTWGRTLGRAETSPVICAS
jgi:hypothetical protein